MGFNNFDRFSDYSGINKPGVFSGDDEKYTASYSLIEFRNAIKQELYESEGYVDEPGNEGITGTVTLATSHAAIHVWDRSEPPMFQFDIYSCTCFSADEVLEHINEFGLISCEYIYIDRNGDTMNVVEQKKISYEIS
jgi:hypothetical protein